MIRILVLCCIVAAVVSDGVSSGAQISAGGVLMNDSDVDGDELTAVIATSTTHGELTLTPQGGFEYNPIAGFFGVDTFTYRAFDGFLYSNIATVSISVLPDYSPFVMEDFFTLSEDGALACSAGTGVLMNDSDVETEELTAQLVTTTQHGTLQFNEDGSFRYDPFKDYNGTDQFTYTVSDGVNVSDPVLVTLTILPVNDPPVAVDDSYQVTIPSGTPQNITRQLTVHVVTGDENVVEASVVIRDKDGGVVGEGVTDDEGRLVLPIITHVSQPAKDYRGPHTVTVGAVVVEVNIKFNVTVTVEVAGD